MALTAKKVYAILKRQISDMEAKLNSPVRYRGTVATADLLPLNPDIGDMYNIESKSIYGEAGMNVAWNGVVWDTMGAPIDMSLYLTKEEAESVIQRLVTEYFEKNPVKPGATTEQAQQIEQNKTDIASLKTETISLKEETASLKESISTKITKFYASSQGETHLADSDDGKIMDMRVYGKSEQKQYSGKNLLNATLQTTTQNGITCTNNGDGTFTLNGTATANCVLIVIGTTALKNAFGENEELKLTGSPKVSSTTGYYLQMWKNEPDVVYRDTGGGVTVKKPNADCNVAIMVTNGTVCNNVLFKPMLTVDPTVTYDDFEPYHETEVTLPYDLYGIKVTSGGNVAINGQQYASDYFDVERGKIVRMVDEFDTKNLTVFDRDETDGVYRGYFSDSVLSKFAAGNSFRTKSFDGESIPNATRQYSVYMDKSDKGQWLNFICDSTYRETDDLKAFIQNTGIVYGILETPEEIDLTPEEVQALKALATYYPVTNISVNSEQLDGYAVFNYPVSMENGWNYVKQQLNDNRDYIYNMDARTQDTDLQAAEAYVNSEYAVALTELEV